MTVADIKSRKNQALHTASLIQAVVVALLLASLTGLSRHLPAALPLLQPLQNSFWLHALLGASLLAAGTSFAAAHIHLPSPLRHRLARGLAPAPIFLLILSLIVMWLGYWAGLTVPAPVALPVNAALTLASLAVFMAFPLLIAERIVAAQAFDQYGDTRGILALSRLPIAAFLLLAAAALALAAGQNLLIGARNCLYFVLFCIGTDLGFRALHRLLAPTRLALPLPRPWPFHVLVLRPLGDGFSLRPRHVSAYLRKSFGIDFARSWALQFIGRALPPMALILIATCVMLSGLVRIDTTERGIYQRLGQPVAVLKPGLHLLLPWPLGQVRRVDYGVIHAVPVVFEGDKNDGDQDLMRVLFPTTDITAEGPPPVSANRLWDSTQPSDATYLVAARQDDAHKNGAFELISVSMRVMYRTGLDADSAKAAAYGVTDGDTLVRRLASQALARHMATATLQAALVEDPGLISRYIHKSVQDNLDHLHSGLEILSVVVETLHPPPAASNPYRHVQAAEIDAHTAISLERGRAHTTLSLAQRDAATKLDQAAAARAERLAAANAQRVSMRADKTLYDASPQAFALEHRLAALDGALASAQLDIIDPKLYGAAPPSFDLRDWGRVP